MLLPVIDLNGSIHALTFDNFRLKLSIVYVPVTLQRGSLTAFGQGPADPMSQRADLLQGSLDLLVLETLAGEPLHGWGISKRIRERSADVLQVNQGSLYPALYRLEERGWIEAEQGLSPEGRRARIYRLTPQGRRQLESERESWRRFATAVERVLSPA
jgi:transcriptional regulator